MTTFDREHRVATSGGTIAIGDLGAGPPVVLIHGFPQSSYVWRDLAPLLSSRFRVLVPDLIGSGASDRPAGVSLDIRAQAGYLGEALADLGVKQYAVVGHSVGGGVAQLLALDGAGADAMVLISSTALDAWPTALTHEIQLTPPDQEVELFVDSGMRAAFRVGMTNPDRLGEEHVARYLHAWSGEEGVASFFRFARALDGQGLDRANDLAAIDIPVLIFWGEEDPFYPATVAERLNAAIPSSTLGLLPGCGHFLVDEAIETIGPMIYEYLRARYLKAPHGHGDPSGIVTIQLERRPPWVDLAEDEEDAWHDVDEEGDA